MLKGVLAMLRNSDEIMQLWSSSQLLKTFWQTTFYSNNPENRNFKDYQYFTKKKIVAQREYLWHKGHKKTIVNQLIFLSFFLCFLVISIS